MSQLIFQIFRVIRKFQTEILTSFQSLICIRHRMKPSKHNYTLNVQSPFSIVAISLVIYTIGNFVTGTDRIKLVPLFCTMKIKIPTSFIIPVIHRNPIRISIIPQHRKDTTRLIFQNLNTFILPQFLLKPSHLTKHNHPSFLYYQFLNYTTDTQLKAQCIMPVYPSALNYQHIKQTIFLRVPPSL